jgi:hypothetical protein
MPSSELGESLQQSLSGKNLFEVDADIRHVG